MQAALHTAIRFRTQIHIIHHSFRRRYLADCANWATTSPRINLFPFSNLEGTVCSIRNMELFKPRFVSLWCLGVSITWIWGSYQWLSDFSLYETGVSNVACPSESFDNKLSFMIYFPKKQSTPKQSTVDGLRPTVQRLLNNGDLSFFSLFSRVHL